MQASSPLTGEYTRAFERHATGKCPVLGASVPCWDIMAYVADILDIAARELGESLDLCRLAHHVGIDTITFNANVQLLKPNEFGAIAVIPESGETVIVLRETLSKEAKRFTLAHEIGHYMLHVRRTESEYNVYSSAQIEQEAEIFAGALVYLLDQRAAQKAAYVA